MRSTNVTLEKKKNEVTKRGRIKK